MKRFIPCILALSLAPSAIAQPAPAKDTLKTLRALRILSAPKIDGVLDDEAWKNAEIATGFIQGEPNYQQPSTQRTEVKVIYDNTAVYIGAFMYDSSPDSILHQLGSRDQDNLNSDYFMVGFDTYSKLIDGYVFGVSASGIQLDLRFQEESFDAVWQSAVKINDKGWCAELKIPYSAIRFPDSKEQNWRIEFERKIRRIRESSRWTFIPKDQESFIKYFGKLEGVSDIQPPLRLSLTPYLSSYYEIAPGYNNTGSNIRSFSYNAGADIKYGLNESFTLDMTLLPDFGQVQSDNKVKNLSYMETVYDEYRPFFKEGTELFNKAGMFYSRRIGKNPGGFYDVPGMLKNGEVIDKNPVQAKLLNATKLSGRTNNGTGIGLFNALTDNTYAVLRDSAGKERNILTEPLTNYNAFVFDQQLKNSSNAYFMNTNVMRDGSRYRDANVTGSGFTFQNKKNSWAIDGTALLSQLFTRNDSISDAFEDQMGYSYGVGIRKISGTWQFGVSHTGVSSAFDRTDMGYQSLADFASFGGRLSYGMYKPRKSLLRANMNLNTNYRYNYSSGLRTGFNTGVNGFFLFKSYFSVWGGADITPIENYDYYEPRTPGRHSYTVQGYWLWTGFSTDYRKKIAVDITLNSGAFAQRNVYDLEGPLSCAFEIKPRIRINDKLSFIYEFNFNHDPNNLGYANTDSMDNIIYGERILDTYINTLTAKYIFKNDLSFSLNARHYWNTGEYIRYYTLLENGMIDRNYGYSTNNDFSYNAFNIDAVFSWQFAPGSLVSLVYKNAIEKDEQIILPSFSDNFSKTISSPQTNSISLKVLYYLDYQYLKRKK